jgi:hypothetical protein
MIIYVCYTINVKIIHKVYIHISLNVLCNSFFIDIDSYTFKHNTVLTLNEWHRVDKQFLSDSRFICCMVLISTKQV